MSPIKYSQKKFSKTPAKERKPRMDVGNGAVAIASEKFVIEKKIMDYKKEKYQKYKEQKMRNMSVTISHKTKINTKF